MRYLLMLPLPAAMSSISAKRNVPVKHSLTRPATRASHACRLKQDHSANQRLADA